MNRIEFINKLESLLRDMPIEERDEAVKFYQDYFDDAGAENESKVVAELGSPEKVASLIKTDIKTNAGMDGTSQGENCEYSETGYTDTRFEEKDIPVPRGASRSRSDQAADADKKQPWTSQPLKVILVILIAIVVCTAAWPVIGGIVALAVGLFFAAIGLFIGLVIGAICIMIAGFVVFIVGMTKIVVALPVALVTCGSGILLFVLGAIATVAAIKLCIIVYPAMIRGIVYVCKLPFQGRGGRKVS